MKSFHSNPFSMKRLTVALATAALASTMAVRAEEPLRIVFQGGRTVPIDALELKGNQFVVTVAQDGLSVGQAVPTSAADHIFGDKPEAVNKGVAHSPMIASPPAAKPIQIRSPTSAAVHSAHSRRNSNNSAAGNPGNRK